MKKIRFGLVGFSQGYYAVKYTTHLSRLNEVEVAGCCDLGAADDYVKECAFVTAEGFARDIGIKLFKSPQELYAEGLDAVMISCETWQHADYAVDALEKGMHVFISKPASFKSDDIRRLMKAQKKSNKIVLCGQPLRYEEAFTEMSKRIKDGAIGEVTNIRFFLNHEAMIRQEWERDVKRSGGPLGTYGVYMFDVPNMLTGLKVKELYAMGANLVYPQIGTYDTVSISARMNNGAIANMNLVSTISWDYPLVRADVVGTKGVVRANFDNPTYILSGRDEMSSGSLRRTELGNAEIEHFMDCVRGRSECVITLDDMLYAAQCIEASFESAETCKMVKI